jgi:hypothetical protein
MTRRPLRATLLLWLVLFLISYNALRLWTAISWSSVLSEANSRPGWVGNALIGGLWICCGFTAAYGIFTKTSWARSGVIGLSIAYIAGYWIERLVWQAPRPNWLFALILQIGLLTFILYASSGVNRESHGGKSSSQKIK